jgi:hypothetical protein
MVESTRGDARRRMQEVTDHYRRAGLQPVQDHVVTRQADEIPLHLEADEAGVRHTRSKTQHRSAGPATNIEHELMRFGRHCGGKEHRIDRGAISGCGLPYANPTTEQPIFGEGGLSSRDLAHHASSPAAVKTEQARR